jgi:uncharacterized membrane protein YkoI
MSVRTCPRSSVPVPAPRLAPPTRRAWLAVLAATGVGVAAAAIGAAPVSARGRDDHERAREALGSGEVLPLHEVLGRLQRTHPGQVLEVELEREDGRWRYEVKLLQPGGRLARLQVDARTAEVLRESDPGPGRRGRQRP